MFDDMPHRGGKAEPTDCPPKIKRSENRSPIGLKNHCRVRCLPSGGLHRVVAHESDELAGCINRYHAGGGDQRPACRGAAFRQSVREQREAHG